MRPFFHLDLEGLDQVIRHFPFDRRIDSVHLHHTWRPNHRQYRGEDSIVGMWRFHTAELGWSDIAQHLTIGPDGSLWTGRDWNRPPASARGFNGNRAVGPFMIEMIGDFDEGEDALEGEQLLAVVGVIARLQVRLELAADAVTFHNQMSAKTCPGDAISKTALLRRLREARKALRDADDDHPSAPPSPFDDTQHAHRAVIDGIRHADGARAGVDGDELPEREGGAALSRFFEFEATGAADDVDTRGGGKKSKITEAEVDALTPYLINLRNGRFSQDGLARTHLGDVARIFEEDLPRAHAAAKQAGRALRVLFYAHGGLVAEKRGLGKARDHVTWWRDNHVYPIYFIWETGLFETLSDLLFRADERHRGARGILDWPVEKAVRILQGDKIWSGMKRSAARAFDGGDGLAVTRHAATFLANAGDGVELHGVGHSAGAIFLSHFIPALHREAGNPRFKTAHFLAPAIRVDRFKDRLFPASANGKRSLTGIDHLTLFTMRDTLERADTVTPIYRKSLLYLIYKALEDRKKTDLVGLEKSVRADPDLKALFGLGTPSQIGEAVWSTSSSATGRQASRSTTHGGFDDDDATMNSIALRVLGLHNEDAPPVPFAASEDAARSTSWVLPSEVPEGLEFLQRDWLDTSGPSRPVSVAPVSVAPVSMASHSMAPAIAIAPPGATVAGPGRNRALCVGIDDYASNPLGGCVADADAWARTLGALGFDVDRLRDHEATRGRILSALRERIDSSRAGDVIVFQFAGHGTQIVDLDGDEGPEGLDEALCPIDFDEGRLIIDDDLRGLFDRLPEGVNATCFFDCCHSGTAARVLGARGHGRARAGVDERPRFVKAEASVIEAHRAFRARMGGGRSASVGPEAINTRLFAACQPHELAWESNGQGDFTRNALAILGQGIVGLSHEGFLAGVRGRFGATGRQTPTYDGAADTNAQPLLGAIGP